MGNVATGRPAHQPEVHAQPRSWLQPFLLLSLEQWQSHGYELIRRLALFGFETVDPGSVYRTLRQLERDGLVESSWDTTGGPARRRYAVTDAGRTYLDGWAGALRAYQHMLDRFFSTYPGDGPDGPDGPDGSRTGEREPAVPSRGRTSARTRGPAD